MSEILHANIFFFIASLATIAFSIFICIALYYLVKILQSVRRIVDRVEAASDQVADDIATAREYVVSGGLVSYLIGLVLPKPRRRSRGQKHEDITSEPD